MFEALGYLYSGQTSLSIREAVVAAPADGERRVPVFSVLFSRGFFPYFAGNMTSNVGTWFQNIAQSLLIFRLTDSAFMVGVVNFAQFLPILILVPVAGRVADRFDRRSVVMISSLAALVGAVLVTVLTIADMAPPWIVIVIAFVIGSCNAFIVPSLQSLVPSLVTSKELPSAVALHSATVNLGRALGPALGALVVATWGIAPAFAVNAFSFLVLIGAMKALRPISKPAPATGAIRLRDSIVVIQSDPRLWVPIIVVALASFATDPVATLTPVLAERVYGFADTYAGFLIGAFGTGAVAAAFIVTGRFRPSIRTIGITLGGTAIAIGSVAATTEGGLALLPFFVAGAFYLTTVTTATSTLHLAVADQHRGRVMAIWTMAFHGIRPISALIDGSLATALSPRTAVVIMALIPLIVATTFATGIFPRRGRGSALARAPKVPEG